MNSLELRDNRESGPGDIGICQGCGRVMIFTLFGVRDPNLDEANLIGADKEVQSIRQSILDQIVRDPLA